MDKIDDEVTRLYNLAEAGEVLEIEPCEGYEDDELDEIINNVIVKNTTNTTSQ
jgi:hypothetical protein